MTDNQTNPAEAAVLAVRETSGKNDIVTLASGVRARIKPVSASLISAATGKIKDPDVPKWYNEEKQREEENPNDPKYRAALTEAEQQRGEAAMNVMYIMGIELVDPIPESGWIEQLEFMKRMGTVDLGDLDLADPLVRDFVYKKYIAVSSEDLVRVARKSGISQEALANAEGTF